MLHTVRRRGQESPKGHLKSLILEDTMLNCCKEQSKVPPPPPSTKKVVASDEPPVKM